MTISEISARAAAQIGCIPAAVWATAQVESSGGRALHRYERHVFLRASGRHAKTFEQAWAIDPELACQASSWGAFHVMGRWYQMLNYESARDMADDLASMDNAEAQINSMVNYCMVVSPGSGSALRSLDAVQFALQFNGPKGVERGYHIKWRKALARAGHVASRVLRCGDAGKAVETLQRRLGVHPVDGIFGTETLDAVKRFQASEGLVVDGIVGRATWSALKAEKADAATVNAPGIGESVEGAMRSNPGKTTTGGGIGAIIAGWLGIPELRNAFSRFFDLDLRSALAPLKPYLPHLAIGALAIAAIIFISYAIKEYQDARRIRKSAADLDTRGGEPHRRAGHVRRGGADLFEWIDPAPDAERKADPDGGRTVDLLPVESANPNGGRARHAKLGHGPVTIGGRG